MCCACGGGSAGGDTGGDDGTADDGGDDGSADGGGVCEDADNGALDAYGDGCAGYTSFPSWCGGYDDDDFNSVEMCCACGGGDSNGRSNSFGGVKSYKIKSPEKFPFLTKQHGVMAKAKIASNETVVDHETSNGTGQFDTNSREGWVLIGSYYHYDDAGTIDHFGLINFDYGADAGPYAVSSVNSTGMESELSNEVSITLPVLAAPEGLVAIEGDGYTNLSWTYDGYEAPELPNCAGTLSWLADGYCDSINNNPECGWDSGDCCESSCVDANYTCGDNFQDDADGDGLWDNCMDPAHGGAGLPTCEEDDYQFAVFNGMNGEDCSSTYTNVFTISYNAGCEGVVHVNGAQAYTSAPPIYGIGWYDADGNIQYFGPNEEHFFELYIDGVVVASEYESTSDVDCAATDPYPNCAGTLSYINDGWCDTSNNNLECGWDGGDCCPGDCLDNDGSYTQPSTCSNYASCDTCLDSDSADVAEGGECYDDGTADGGSDDGGSDDGGDDLAAACTAAGGQASWMSDGYCDGGNNIAECGFDGGDCCESTCVEGPQYDCSTACSGDCLDPEASDDECAPPTCADTSCGTYVLSGSYTCWEMIDTYGFDCSVCEAEGIDCSDPAADGGDDGTADDGGSDDGGDVSCTDTDDGATDAYGDGCAGYTSFPSWCGGYDDDDFVSTDMCCACGGGSTGTFAAGNDAILKAKLLVSSGFGHGKFTPVVTHSSEKFSFEKAEPGVSLTDREVKLALEGGNSNQSYRVAEGFNVYLDGALVESVFETNYQVSGGGIGCYAVSAFDSSPVYESALSEEACVEEAGCALAGDSNNDGSVNVSDIVLLVGAILNGAGDVYGVECGDMDENGTINVSDIVGVVNIILGGRIASQDNATSATLVMADNSLKLDADGFVQGVQITLSHDSNFSINLVDAYISEYKTSDNMTTLVVVSDGDASITDIATFNGDCTIEDVHAVSSTSDITVEETIELASFEVTVAGPNPFNPSTQLNIVVPEAGYVSVKVFNVLGQQVASLIDGQMDANSAGHLVNWNASNLASGVYIVRAATAGKVSTQKLMLLK
jgi:hypothetical protein